jgi:hypothetical protein
VPANRNKGAGTFHQVTIRTPDGVFRMQAESKGSFAVIRYNLRTYESGGVMAVIRGKESAESVLKQFEQSQTSEDRHIGWRYFLEKTDLKVGMDPVEATNLRQSRLELRESEA